MFAIVTMHNSRYKDLAAITWPNKLQYARKHGYVTYLRTDFAEDDNRMYFQKLHCMLDVFKKYPRVKWAWWMDCDIMITNFNVKLLDVIDWQYHVIISACDNNSINSGSFLVRNSNEGRRWLSDIIDMFPQYSAERLTNPTKWNWHEQSAMQMTIDNYRDILKIVPQRKLNSFDYRALIRDGATVSEDQYVDQFGLSGQWEPGDFLLHFATVRNPDRVEFCEKVKPYIMYDENTKVPETIYNINEKYFDNYQWNPTKLPVVQSLANCVEKEVIFKGRFEFDSNLRNPVLDSISSPITVYYPYYISDVIKSLYPNITFKLDVDQARRMVYTVTLEDVNKIFSPDPIEFTSFISCYDPNILLSSCLHSRRLWRRDSCVKLPGDSMLLKSLLYNHNRLDEHYEEMSWDPSFFTSTNLVTGKEFDNAEFEEIYKVQKISHSSLINLVQEEMPLSYYPHVSSRVFYPIIIGQLWIAFAPPGYHQLLKNVYGFKLFDCFDYKFDSIENPVDRVVTLVDMLNDLRSQDVNWTEYYTACRETIGFNFNHYASGEYLKRLRLFIHD